MDESLRRKAVKKKLKVTFDDGTVICYKNATTTFSEAIKKIGPELAASAGLEIGHLPLVSQVNHERYKGYMVEVAEGWWVNTQSDSSQKYLQLLAIKNRLNLSYEVKLAEEFDSYTENKEKRERGSKDNFGVAFEDGSKAHGENSTVVYLQAIEILGADRIAAKGFEWKGNEIVTRFKKYNGQIQLKNGFWAYIPNQMKDKINVLNNIATKLGVKIKILVVSEMLNMIDTFLKETNECEDKDELNEHIARFKKEAENHGWEI